MPLQHPDALDGASADSELEASTGVKSNAAHRATNTMTPVNGMKRGREVRRSTVVGINRSFQNQSSKTRTFIRKIQNTAGRKTKVLAAFLARVKQTLPKVLYRLPWMQKFLY